MENCDEMFKNLLKAINDKDCPDGNKFTQAMESRDICEPCFKKMLDKRTFKICEAVHLGIDHYYMAKNDRRTLTNEDYELAKRMLPTLPEGWYRERHEWDSVKW